MAHVTRKFEWTTCDQHGNDGWVPTQLRDVFDASTSGHMVAHDTLEHFKLDGTAEDELMAFGQLYFIRVETGRVRNYQPISRTSGDLIGSDLQDIFRSTDYACIAYIRAPGNPKGDLDTLREAEAETRDAFMKYLDTDAMSAEDVEDFKSEADAWFTVAYRWLQRGYLMALRRWAGKGSLATGYCGHEAADMFWQLADEVAELTKDGEFVGGETMTIHCNIRRRSYNIVFGSRYYDPRRF